MHSRTGVDFASLFKTLPEPKGDKATGSRECAPDDRLRVPTPQNNSLWIDESVLGDHRPCLNAQALLEGPKTDKI
ncbi:MAG: hypothetical protein QOG17_2695 [Gammaproteobacteria bacterium]|jgi:hypothetical protein|nr:hypothetical protein [Gammaproteobacteria bacterium]